jgi:hypothetical protein
LPKIGSENLAAKLCKWLIQPVALSTDTKRPTGIAILPMVVAVSIITFVWAKFG